ncbi:MAG: hypothetical protein JWP87_621 [Labilithrix sp.]|nr:hypothetical protein [Labilithrix sp.]
MSSVPPSGRTDPAAHKRYLEYRDKHGYFGKMTPLLTMAQFEALEAEFTVLEAKGEDARDDEEAARWDEVAKLLFRD